MEKLVYKPKGVCPKEMTIEINDNIIENIIINGGCPGNSLGLKELIIGREIDEIIGKLQGIKCGFKNTSCPNEIAEALISYKEKKNK